MFKPKYKLTVVNPDKNIVSLQLTKGTWAKYIFLPTALYVGCIAALYIADKTDEQPKTEDKTMHLYDS